MNNDELQAYKNSLHDTYLGENIYNPIISYLKQVVQEVPSDIESIKSALGNIIAGKNPVQGQVISPLPAVKSALTQQAQTLSPTPIPIPALDPKAFGNFTTTPVPPKYSSLIYNSAKNNNIDPNVFASLLFTEHGFSENPGFHYNPDGTYDRGFAQLNSNTVKDDKVALDPNQAIPIAANLLRSHLDQFGGDYNRAIAAYNVGPGGASIQGPMPFGGGPMGQVYLDKVTRGLSSQLIKQLNLKPSFNVNQ